MTDATASATQEARTSAEALVSDILAKVPLVDGHNDLPLVILNDGEARGGVAAYRLDAPLGKGDTDIPRLRAGQVGLQVLAAFTASGHPHPATRTLELIDVIHQIWDLYPKDIHPVLTSDDALAARRAGKIGALLAVEGGVGIENSLAPLRVWQRLGMRLMTLCHNASLDWVDSATDAPKAEGLTGFGRQVIAELNRLGVIIDLAHVAPEAMRQVLDVTRAPVAISHSNAHALCAHPRNVPDDILDRLAANDGIVMATFIPDFVSEEVRHWMAPVRKLFRTDFNATARLDAIRRYEVEHGPRPRSTLAQVADHIEYMAARAGPTRVGIGSDFFGIPIHTQGLEDPSLIRNILVEMALRGWSDENIANLAGLNFLRVFCAVESRRTTRHV